MDKPDILRGDVQEVNERRVRLWFRSTEPWLIRHGYSQGGYILPDLIVADYKDGKIDTVSLSGQRCRKNGERWGEKRPNDYFTWQGKYVQPAPEWVYEALIDNGADHTCVALTWEDVD